MKKIIVIITGIILVLVSLFTLIGIFSSKTFSGNQSAEYNSSINQVWKVLTNITDLPNRRQEITGIEILEKDEKGNPKKWKEITDMGGYIIFESLIWEEGKRMKLKMAESTFGMSGEWDYVLEEINGGKTKVTIVETSSIDSLSVRAIMTLAGRDSNLKVEHENLKKGLELD